MLRYKKTKAIIEILLFVLISWDKPRPIISLLKKKYMEIRNTWI
jgi:hypothetical protein